MSGFLIQARIAVVSHIIYEAGSRCHYLDLRHHDTPTRKIHHGYLTSSLYLGQWWLEYHVRLIAKHGNSLAHVHVHVVSPRVSHPSMPAATGRQLVPSMNNLQTYPVCWPRVLAESHVQSLPTCREAQTNQFPINRLTVPPVPSQRLHCEFPLALRSIQALNWNFYHLCILCDSYSWLCMLTSRNPWIWWI